MVEMEKIFEKALRNKIRFNYRGVLSTEDLWDLPLQQLDTIFKNLNKELKQLSEESLLNVKTKADEELELKVELIKYIVKTKQAEAKVKQDAKEEKERKQKIMELIARKKDAELEGKSLEELEAML